LFEKKEISMKRKAVFGIFALAAVMLMLNSCGPKEHDFTAALASLDTAELIEDVKILGSDEFEGRLPSTPGEEKTIKFIEEGYKKVGLEPGNGDSYFQDVPLVEITAEPEPT